MLTLTTKDIVNSSAIDTIKNISQNGKQQYEKFVKERLVQKTTALIEPIPQNRYILFKHHTPKTTSKGTVKLQAARNDCKLFSKLYIGCQNRDGNPNEFFSHENQACPPSISDTGQLRSGNKSEMLNCLESLANYHMACPRVSTLIVDGPVLVQMLKPGLTRTFLQYHKEVFMPYLLTQLATIQRIDIIWDEYIDNSLKKSTRSKRGNGPRRRVLANTPLPTNWQAFLRNCDNKKELFGFLAHQTVQYTIPNKTIITTVKEFVLSSPSISTNNLQPCSHEEADTRIFVHVLNAVKQGHSKLMIRTVDTSGY